jgi:hypothetical protein
MEIGEDEQSSLYRGELTTYFFLTTKQKKKRKI